MRKRTLVVAFLLGGAWLGWGGIASAAQCDIFGGGTKGCVWPLTISNEAAEKPFSFVVDAVESNSRNNGFYRISGGG